LLTSRVLSGAGIFPAAPPGHPLRPRQAGRRGCAQRGSAADPLPGRGGRGDV